MGQLISIHSYRGGTGKSNLTANLAYLAAKRGRRVAVLDTDVQSPGVHMVLGMDPSRMVHSLSDYLFGKCELEDAAYDMTTDLGLQDSGGALFLLPSSMKVEAIVRVVSEGYDAGRLNEHLQRLMQDLSIDLLWLDTHPGLNRETMLTTAVSQALVVVVRPDTQDFHGTAVLMELAGRLGVPHVSVLINKVVARLDAADVRKKVEQAFKQDVIGLLPLSDDLLVLGSRGLIASQEPDHPVSLELDQALSRLLDSLQGAPPAS